MASLPFVVYALAGREVRLVSLGWVKEVSFV